MRRCLWLWWVVGAGGCLEVNPVFVEPPVGESDTVVVTGIATELTDPLGETTDSLVTGPGSTMTDWYGTESDTHSTQTNQAGSTLVEEQPSCGDGFAQAGEACDDGDDDPTNECTNECTVAVCGDGYVHAGFEDCDDGNGVPNDGCEDSCKPSVRFVFVTSEMVVASELMGLGGADKRCNTLAAVSGLPGSYMAWLSTDMESPATRMKKWNLPYVRVDEVPVAMNWGDLVDGSLLAPINLDEHGDPAPGSGMPECGMNAVHSNTNEMGLPSGQFTDCGGWMMNEGYTNPGMTTTMEANWTFGCGNGEFCGVKQPFYCVQQ